MSPSITIGPAIFGAVLISGLVVSLTLIGKPKTYRVGIWLLGGVVVAAVAAGVIATV